MNLKAQLFTPLRRARALFLALTIGRGGRVIQGDWLPAWVSPFSFFCALTSPPTARCALACCCNRFSQRLNGLLLRLESLLAGRGRPQPTAPRLQGGRGLQEGDLGGGTHVSVRPDFSPLGNPGDLALPANIEKLRFQQDCHL